MMNKKETPRAPAGEPRCIFCHRPGARWQIRVNGEFLAVHRGCGNTLANLAPQGQEARVKPSPALVAEWRARAFWKEKFQEAQAKAAQKAAKAAPPTPAKT